MWITCVAAMLIAAEGTPDITAFIYTSIGLMLSTGGASVLNHVWDRDIDRLMPRTSLRPIAKGRITARFGTIYGVVLMIAGFVVLFLLVNLLSALLALFGGLFYVLVYTIALKRFTVHNTVLGGVAGSMPPMVGWAAQTNEITSTMPWLLAILMFLWQPAHFWPLSLVVRDDYSRAGVPMLSVTHGEKTTALATWRWAIFSVLFSVAVGYIGNTGWLYYVAAIAIGIWYLQKTYALKKAVEKAPEGKSIIEDTPDGRQITRAAFLASMPWLAILFLALVIDSII